MKYRKGEVVKSVQELMAILENGELVYIRDQVLSQGWIESFQFRYLKHIIKSGIVRRAIKKETV